MSFYDTNVEGNRISSHQLDGTFITTIESTDKVCLYELEAVSSTKPTNNSHTENMSIEYQNSNGEIDSRNVQEIILENKNLKKQVCSRSIFLIYIFF